MQKKPLCFPTGNQTKLNLITSLACKWVNHTNTHTQKRYFIINHIILLLLLETNNLHVVGYMISKGSVLTHAVTFLQKCDEVSFFRLTLPQPAPLIHTQLSPYSDARSLRNVAQQGRRHQISPGGSMVLAWEMKTACHIKWILHMIFHRKLSKVIRQLAQPPYLFLCTRSKVEMIRAILSSG